MSNFKAGDYVLSNYMLSHGNGTKDFPSYCLGKISKYNMSVEYDFAIRNITAINKERAGSILEDLKYYTERDQYGCFKYNLRLLELTDPHFINAIINQVFIEKEEEVKFKEYIRAKIQTDFKIPTLDSVEIAEISFADIITVNKASLTEDFSTWKPKVVYI